ncbi:hypothetical protein [Streptomyces sp. NPDC002324]
MSSVHTLRAPSSQAQVFAPWRTRTPGQAQPWRSLMSLGLDPEPDPQPDPESVPGAQLPGAPGVVESAPVPRRAVRDRHPIPQEA